MSSGSFSLDPTEEASEDLTEADEDLTEADEDLTEADEDLTEEDEHLPEEDEHLSEKDEDLTDEDEDISDGEKVHYPDDDDPFLRYWRRHTKVDIKHLLTNRDYQDEAIKRFMHYFIHYIPPAWCFRGGKNSIGPNHAAPTLNQDNSPIEMSLNFTSVMPNPIDRPPARIIAVVDHVTAKKTLEEYIRRNVFGCIDYKMDWLDSLYRSVMKGGSTYIGDVRVGFDVRQAVRVPRGPNPIPGGPIPADARAYFVPARKAEALGVTRWALVREAILSLPGIKNNNFQMRRIVAGVILVDEFLADNPPEFGNLLSTVDMGPEEPASACIGLSFTVPAGATSADFREVWKWLTLGWRITALRQTSDDRDSFEAFFRGIYGWDASDLAGGGDNNHEILVDNNNQISADNVYDMLADNNLEISVGNNDEIPADNVVDLGPYIYRCERLKAGTFLPQVAPCSVHIALATDSPQPRVTLSLDVAYDSNTDYEVALRFRDFLLSHTRHPFQEWYGWDAPYIDIVKDVFSGRLPLGAESFRVHNSFSLCRQEGLSRKEWSARASYNPLYYKYPRPPLA